MPSPIVVNFKVGGTEEISRAFRTVQQAADRLENRTKQQYRTEEQLARKSAKDKEAAAIKVEKDRDKEATAAIKAAEKVTNEKLREEMRWARQRETIQTNAAKLAFRLADEEVKAFEQAERKKSDIRARFAKATGSRIMGDLGGMARGAVGMVGGALALGGGFGIADAVQQRFALERTAAIFSNQSSSTGGRISTQDIMSKSRAVGISNNVDPNQVAQAMTTYFARSSNAEGAMKNAGLFAQLSKATGTDINEIADVAGSLQVQNKDLDEKGMRNLLMGLVGQTRKGSVDIRELAQYVPVLTGTSGLYGGDQAMNQQKLIGLAQIAKPVAGGPAEAATAVKAFGLSLTENASKIRGGTGYNVKDSSGNLKDPAEIIATLMQKTGGDAGKLKALGINREALTPFLAEQQVFKKAGGGEAGKNAVMADIRQYTEGGYNEQSLAADVGNVSQGSGEKFAAATAKVQEVLQDKLTPYLERFADKVGDPSFIQNVTKLIDAVAGLAEFFIDNPFTGIGAVVMGTITKDIASAAIGETIKTALAKSAGAGGSGALGLAVAGGVAITATQAWIETSLDDQAKNSKQTAGGLTEAQNAIADLKSDPNSKEKQEKARKVLARIQNDEAHIGDKGALGQVAGLFQSKESSDEESARNRKLFLDLADSATKLQKALDAAAKSANDAKPTGGDKGVTHPVRTGPISGRT